MTVCNHVTTAQFRAVLNVKLGLDIPEADVQLLIEKYVDDAYGDLVNYVVFANAVDPAVEQHES